MKGIHILFSILFLFWLFVFCLIIYIYIFAPESTREDEKRRAIARLSLKSIMNKIAHLTLLQNQYALHLFNLKVQVLKKCRNLI